MARGECNVTVSEALYPHKKMQPCMLQLSLGRLSGLPNLIADAALGHYCVGSSAEDPLAQLGIRSVVPVRVQSFRT